jgi:pyrimidine deaminase RibD-like protein
MYRVVISPEYERQRRSVMVMDAGNQIVAVMNTREKGVEHAKKLALIFAAAANLAEQTAAEA